MWLGISAMLPLSTICECLLSCPGEKHDAQIVTFILLAGWCTRSTEGGKTQQNSNKYNIFQVFTMQPLTVQRHHSRKMTNGN